MKTLLAIALAAAVLISGATVSLMSGAALAQSSGVTAQIWCPKGCPPPPKPTPADQSRGR